MIRILSFAVVGLSLVSPSHACAEGPMLADCSGGAARKSLAPALQSEPQQPRPRSQDRQPAHGESARRDKPAAERPEGSKPQDGTPGVSKPQDGKPQDAKPQDAKPQDGKPKTGKPPGEEPPVSDRPKEGKPRAGDQEPELEEPPITQPPPPKSADPADIAAMQSAQAMLDAERRLREMIKQGKIKNIDQILTFEEISAWPYEDGLRGMPEKLKDLTGRKVMMTGFMLPIDEVENIKQFLLVQSLWSCCYGQPPDINGIVRVVMQGGKRLDYQYEPLKVVGTFRVGPTMEEGYCVDIYQLEATEVEVIR